MKSKTTTTKLLVFTLLLTLILGACSSSTPQTEPTEQQNAQEPTLDISVIETHAAETVYAELTLNALMQEPTETAVPPTATVETSPEAATNTPYILPTSTPFSEVVADTNIVYPTYTPYVTLIPEDENFRCVILNQTIGYEQVMFPGEEFEAGWTIENRGKAYWNAAGIDIVYLSGTKMHTVSNRLDIGQDVAPTGNFSFSISMRAPSTPGYYDANWTFQGDPGTFCPLYVRIKVE